jgi:hypothetical protein
MVDYPFLREALVRSTHRKNEIGESLARFRRDADPYDPATKKRVREFEQELAEVTADVELAQRMIDELPIVRVA